MAKPADFLGDRRGAAAVEFALVGTLFILTTLFVMLAGAILYITQAVDYATNAAARDILTGSAQTNSATLGTFTQSLCSRLPPGIQCANLVINLYTVTQGAQPAGYYAYVKADQSGLSIPALSPGAGQFSLGAQGDFQYLQVIYPITFLPSGFAAMLSGGATFNGKAAYLAIATAAFRNEQY
ncbi:TadE/TadG family type IV pilus assembly protein [Methylobacterium sp. J-076]|uniref:TadE/TadG family type IV pilus assembly protein n=1 Tax=Methylobacterium sp. J-076 TaxID=2836655 RepID=UPI001FB982B9|nr:TadE/TadG family type IV pilus assembly protein [Methylobacterium sp. J-076]MCJ2011397.1 pilus assembly protein [Methylobacterium sp. J-076]